MSTFHCAAGPNYTLKCSHLYAVDTLLKGHSDPSFTHKGQFTCDIGYYSTCKKENWIMSPVSLWRGLSEVWENHLCLASDVKYFLSEHMHHMEAMEFERWGHSTGREGLMKYATGLHRGNYRMQCFWNLTHISRDKKKKSGYLSIWFAKFNNFRF